MITKSRSSFIIFKFRDLFSYPFNILRSNYISRDDLFKLSMLNFEKRRLPCFQLPRRMSHCKVLLLIQNLCQIFVVFIRVANTQCWPFGVSILDFWVKCRVRSVYLKGACRVCLDGIFNVSSKLFVSNGIEL